MLWKKSKGRTDIVEKETLAHSVSHVLEEARMVLPGIQALFGFQLIAVFTNVFQQQLTSPEKLIHLLATGLTVTAFGIILAPAAYHRQAEPESISEKFIRISTTLLRIGLIPLLIAISLDFYLVGKLTTGDTFSSACFAFALFTLLGTLWFILPQNKALQKMLSE